MVIGQGAGVYAHVPFCASICHYCDFNRVLDDDPGLKERYAQALLAEVEAVAADGPGEVSGAAGLGGPGEAVWPEFGSLFVGGGTPTTLPARDLAAVVDRILRTLPFAQDAEVTVEANPETVTEPYMRELAAAGVNRVSMGAQSFAPAVLEFLGRRHSAERPLRAVDAVRAAGIGQVSLDLIYGSPGETPEDWERSLSTALGAGLDHVSAYALTVEPGTPYAGMVRDDPALAPDEDVQAERMAVADEVLAAAGLRRYEVSNWALPGAESRHNLVYWRGGDWLALGAGAHGHWRGRRWWNLRPPDRYVASVLSGGRGVAGEEAIDERTRRTERLMMGLRLAEGVERAAVEPVDEAAVERLSAAGLLAQRGGRLVVTPEGRAVTGAVVLALLAD